MRYDAQPDIDRFDRRPCTSSSSFWQRRPGELLAEPGLGQLLLGRLGAGRDPGLHHRLEVDVAEDALADEAATAEQPPHLVRLEALEVAEQEALERHVQVGLQEQGIEEGLAELAVAGPRGPGCQPLEGPDVDEHGLRARATAR